MALQVLKVLHGADSDIVWLQRDFDIHIANLFDTGQAARVLQYPSAGLAYLLSRFCSVKVQPLFSSIRFLFLSLSCPFCACAAC
jgi:exosome complex exonuclease RRP6